MVTASASAPHLPAAVLVAGLMLLLLGRHRRKLRYDVVPPCTAPAACAAAAPSARSPVASFIVPDGGGTLAALLMSELPREFPSRNFVKKTLKRTSQVLVDDAVASSEDMLLHGGQRVEYVCPLRNKQHLARTCKRQSKPALEMEWPHVDEWLAVCVKPEGISVQGDDTAHVFRQAVAWTLPPPSSRPGALSVARHAHRIDKLTGGLVVLARTSAAAAALSSAFAAHGGVVQKTYIALVSGQLLGEGRIDAPVHGKSAISRWRAVSCVRSAASGYVTTVHLWPETGRNHQLRRHLALELGCPILGDPKYASVDARAAEFALDAGGRGLHLWAAAISFPHPSSGERVEISVAEPAHFEERRRSESAAADALTPAVWEEVAKKAAQRQRAACNVREAADDPSA